MLVLKQPYFYCFYHFYRWHILILRRIKLDILNQKFPEGLRVLGYLEARDEPLTAKDIALGISSNTSRVYAQLKKLVGDGVLDVFAHNGFHPEYVIRAKYKG